MTSLPPINKVNGYLGVERATSRERNHGEEVSMNPRVVSADGYITVTNKKGGKRRMARKKHINITEPGAVAERRQLESHTYPNSSCTVWQWYHALKREIPKEFIDRGEWTKDGRQCYQDNNLTLPCGSPNPNCGRLYPFCFIPRWSIPAGVEPYPGIELDEQGDIVIPLPSKEDLAISSLFDLDTPSAFDEDYQPYEGIIDSSYDRQPRTMPRVQTESGTSYLPVQPTTGHDVSIGFDFYNHVDNDGERVLTPGHPKTKDFSEGLLGGTGGKGPKGGSTKAVNKGKLSKSEQEALVVSSIEKARTENVKAKRQEGNKKISQTRAIAGGVAEYEKAKIIEQETKEEEEETLWPTDLKSQMLQIQKLLASLPTDDWEGLTPIKPTRVNYRGIPIYKFTLKNGKSINLLPADDRGWLNFIKSPAAFSNALDSAKQLLDVGIQVKPGDDINELFAKTFNKPNLDTPILAPLIPTEFVSDYSKHPLRVRGTGENNVLEFFYDIGPKNQPTSRENLIPTGKSIRTGIPNVVATLFDNFDIIGIKPLLEEFITNTPEGNFTYTQGLNALLNAVVEKSMPSLGHHTGLGHSSERIPENADDFVSAIHDLFFPGPPHMERAVGRMYEAAGSSSIIPNLIGLGYKLPEVVGNKKDWDKNKIVAETALCDSIECRDLPYLDGGGKPGVYRGMTGIIEEALGQDRIFYPNGYTYEQLEDVSEATNYYIGAYTDSVDNHTTSGGFTGNNLALNKYFVGTVTEFERNGVKVQEQANVPFTAPASCVSLYYRGAPSFNIAPVAGRDSTKFDCVLLNQWPHPGYEAQMTPAYAELSNMNRNSSYSQVSEANRRTLFTPFGSLSAQVLFLMDLNISSSRLASNLTLGYVRALKWSFSCSRCTKQSFTRGLVMVTGIPVQAGSQTCLLAEDLYGDDSYVPEVLGVERQLVIVNIEQFNANKAQLELAGIETTASKTRYIFFSSTQSGGFAGDLITDFVMKTVMLMGTTYTPRHNSDLNINRPNQNDPPIGGHLPTEFIDSAATFVEPSPPYTLIVVTDGTSGLPCGLLAGPNSMGPILANQQMDVSDLSPAAPVITLYNYDEWVCSWMGSCGGSQGLSTITSIAQATNSINQFKKAYHFAVHNFAYFPNAISAVWNDGINSTAFTVNPGPQSAYPIGVSAGADFVYMTGSGIELVSLAANVDTGFRRTDQAPHAYLYLPRELGSEFLVLSGHTIFSGPGMAKISIPDISSYWYERFWALHMTAALHWVVTDRAQVSLVSQYRVQPGMERSHTYNYLYKPHGFDYESNIFAEGISNYIEALSGMNHVDWDDFTFSWGGYKIVAVPVTGNLFDANCTFDLDTLITNILCKRLPSRLCLPVAMVDGLVFPHKQANTEFQRQISPDPGFYTIQTYTSVNSIIRSVDLVDPNMDFVRNQLAMRNVCYLPIKFSGASQRQLPYVAAAYIPPNCFPRPIYPTEGFLAANNYLLVRAGFVTYELIYNYIADCYILWHYSNLSLLNPIQRPPLAILSTNMSAVSGVGGSEIDSKNAMQVDSIFKKRKPATTGEDSGSKTDPGPKRVSEKIVEVEIEDTPPPIMGGALA